ncbi:MAG: response regulator [Stigonema ocellatum SAG 48.90 = DSM 106950]|nr:response regulator [Stigonema ocellatum SAG 48.90 = DSM 106950]
MIAKILVVDDEFLIERLINQQFRKKIRQQEYEFIFAQNGREALEKIQAYPGIDMILSDINMPEMDGLTLLNKVRDTHQDIRTVVITAYGDMKNIRQAMNLGAFDLLNKPIDFQDLEVTITRTLDESRKSKEYNFLMKQAELELIQSKNIFAIRKVVDGIAHAISDPLCFIGGNLVEVENGVTSLIKHLHVYQNKFPNFFPEIQQNAKDIDLEYLLEDLPKMIASMKVGTDRMYDLSASLCAFSRGDSPTKSVVNIAQGIDNILMILRSQLLENNTRSAIEVIKEYGDLPLVMCYPVQLYHVFINIITNAIDAINEASRKNAITEKKMHNYQIRISTSFLEAENAVMIRIKDNGIGLSEELKERIFGYLFTSKLLENRNALGLCISRQIVEQKHSGKLSCTSVPFEGTEFIIQIPI